MSIDDQLSRLGSSADLYLHACKSGATVGMVLWQVQSLIRTANETLDALRDQPTNGTIQLDTGLSDNMRFHLDAPWLSDEELRAPDTIASLDGRPISDEEARELDINMIHGLATDAGLAVLVTTPEAVATVTGRAITGDEWDRVRVVLRDNPEILADVIAQSLKKD